MKQSPCISVVVPTRNAGPRLLDLVDAFDRQTVAAPFEVIVVDDGSTDGSVERLPTRPWLRIVRQQPRNSYAARNHGCRESRGEIIAFTDADCRPTPSWLAAGLDAISDVEIVAGRIEMPPPTSPTVWTYVEGYDWRDQELALTRNAAETANLLVRRECFDRVGGFDETLPSGGDHEFVGRAIACGARAVYAPNAVVLHDARHSGREFLASEWRRHQAVGYRAAQARVWVIESADGEAPLSGSRRSRLRRIGRIASAYVPMGGRVMALPRGGLVVREPASHDTVRLSAIERLFAFLLLNWLLPAWGETAALVGRCRALRDRRN